MGLIKYAYRKTLDFMVDVSYTINNKRKETQKRDNTKRETTPALLYYYKKRERINLSFILQILPTLC
jgi:hypothetical protein